MTDRHSTISQYVSIVQRIERELPELKMRVRFPLGAQIYFASPPTGGFLAPSFSTQTKKTQRRLGCFC